MHQEPSAAVWRVVVIDDHELLSSALTVAFAADGRATVVATAPSLAAGRDTVRQQAPDVVLSDRRLPDGDMDEHLGELIDASPRSRVLLMTGWPTVRSSLAAFEGGARGIVSKTAPVDAIVDSVVRVARGELIVPDEVADRVFGRTRAASRASLSPRELDVLEALASGESSMAAAARLCMSHNTLRNHLSRAMLKLGARDRLGAVAEATRLGLIAPRLPVPAASSGTRSAG